MLGSPTGNPDAAKKRDTMKKLLFLAMIVLAATTYSIAAEKKSIKNIDLDALAGDTQVVLKGTGDEHLALAWWMPNEFWQLTFARDTTTSETDKEAMLNLLSRVSLLVIVQADITSFGAFKFYSKEEIGKKMFVSFTNARGKTPRLRAMKTINPNLELVIDVMKNPAASSGVSQGIDFSSQQAAGN
jgi:hypothetical protein